MSRMRVAEVHLSQAPGLRIRKDASFWTETEVVFTPQEVWRVLEKQSHKCTHLSNSRIIWDTWQAGSLRKQRAACGVVAHGLCSTWFGSLKAGPLPTSVLKGRSTGSPLMRTPACTRGSGPSWLERHLLALTNVQFTLKPVQSEWSPGFAQVP